LPNRHDVGLIIGKVLMVTASDPRLPSPLWPVRILGGLESPLISAFYAIPSWFIRRFLALWTEKPGTLV
jgi:hypothetical protein